MKLIKDCGANVEALRQAHLSDDFIRFEFDHEWKKMSTLLNGETDYERWLHMKGAAEIIL